jgi:preprotein translocase subunit SecG
MTGGRPPGRKRMIILITIIHVIVCLFLIGVVLLQSGTSADLAAAFGGGLGSQTAFGPRTGANVLTKLTTWAAIIFMLTSFTLAVLSARHASGGSVLENSKTAPAKSGPASK